MMHNTIIKLIICNQLTDLILVCVASRFHQEIKKFDVEKISGTFCSNVDTMDLSFLLCSSGMYMYIICQGRS